MQEQVDSYEELERQHDEARVRLQILRQELSSYDQIMTQIREHINQNLSFQKKLSAKKDDERKQSIVKESYDKLEAKFEQFRKSKIDREDEYKRQLRDKNRLESHLNSMKTQIASIKKIQQAQKDQHQPGIADLSGTRKEEPVFNYDVETINFLNECNWNLGESCDRTLAETLLSCFPGGTFLVRSSKSKPNSFALSVVANAKVRHCLIDKIDEDYCFHPAGPNRQNYPTLCSLVMDYRSKSLIKHNPELDTSLVYPVLSQLKKTSKGSPNTTN